jgi:hypothetical protein
MTRIFRLSETFSLRSVIAASAAETDQPFTFLSYTYGRGKGFALKASDTIVLSETAQKIDFAKLGANGDFQNIAAVTIVAGTGVYGNPGYYGEHRQLLFDDLKVHWNGRIPVAHQNGRLSLLSLAHHPMATHPGVADDANHHSAHVAPDGPHPDGLTQHFALPHPEHFGT